MINSLLFCFSPIELSRFISLIPSLTSFLFNAIFLSNNSSIVTLKKFAINGNNSIFGYPVSDSHHEIA